MSRHTSIISYYKHLARYHDRLMRYQCIALHRHVMLNPSTALRAGSVKHLHVISFEIYRMSPMYCAYTIQ
jgi:hypothetical protein